MSDNHFELILDCIVAVMILAILFFMTSCATDIDGTTKLHWWLKKQGIELTNDSNRKGCDL